jgi:hypothetical protein
MMIIGTGLIHFGQKKRKKKLYFFGDINMAEVFTINARLMNLAIQTETFKNK